MNEKEKKQFYLLKRKVAERFLQDYPGTNLDISTWKGLDIVYFQEHLLKKVRANVSEKWFYTYFKQEIIKLPRIDMLNLLSEYVGYKSWNHFLSDHPEETPLVPEENSTLTESHSQKDLSSPSTPKKKSKFLMGIIGVLTVVAGVFGIKFALEPKVYTFCFYDADSNLPIRDEVEVTINKKGESSKRYIIKKNECFNYPSVSQSDTLEMVVSSKFHKQTTLRYILSRYTEDEKIQIEPDEYALMLNYYVTSTQKIKDRQQKLRSLIDNNALIYQVYDNEIFGVEVLTKEQYIGLLTLPTASLKNYTQIYSQTNDKGKITKIKFKIKNDETTP